MANRKTVILIVGIVLVLAIAAGGVVYQVKSDHNNSTTSHNVSNVISYKGVNGVTALALLKKYDRVSTKTYSGLGEEVMAINGKASSSKNYWAFYVDGKMADVGAGSYTTKNSDTITWKLVAD